MPDHDEARSDSVIYTDKYYAIKRAESGELYIETGDSVLIVPLDDSGNIWFIEEPSPAFGTSVLVLPGGSVEQGEKRYITANRELQEEIGYRASQMSYLGEVQPWSKYLRLRSYVFLAQGLIAHKLQGDETYDIPIIKIPLGEVEARIAAGMIHDALTIAAVSLALYKLR